MKITIGRSVALAAIIAAVAGFAPKAIAEDASSGYVTSGKVSGTVTMTSTVEAVDLDKRIVTLKGENGEVIELAVSKEVRNLPQLKKGDRVVATYHEAIAADVYKAGTEMPPAKNAVAAERAKAGEKPGGAVAEVTSATATIDAIDKANSRVTLKGPEGNKVSVKIRDPKKLDAVSVGDQVQITYTRALAISVTDANSPDATLELSGGSVAVGIGYTWGGGTLTYNGKKYPVELSGLSIADVGASKIEASGNVYHLNNLADFDGNYTAATAGITIAGGGSATAMRNQNGVVINVLSTTQGLKFALAASGMSLKIKK
jgi:Cu/Ag efflux protein CusF